MTRYQEFDTVLLRDGRIVTIVEAFEPGNYIADVGHSPKSWDIIWELVDTDILRLATPDEIARESKKSESELKECGLWPTK